MSSVVCSGRWHSPGSRGQNPRNTPSRVDGPGADMVFLDLEEASYRIPFQPPTPLSKMIFLGTFKLIYVSSDNLKSDIKLMENLQKRR